MGSGMLNNDASPTVKHCLFTKNTAEMGGGAMGNNNASPTVADCIFRDNAAKTPVGFDSFGGGAVENFEGTPAFANCKFQSNSCNYEGGAINNFYSGFSATNCVFAMNHADYGGGAVYGNMSAQTITNCSFSGNSTAGANPAGALYGDGNSAVSITNCIFWNDSNGYGNAEIAVSQYGSYASPANYSCVQGGFAGIGNIEENPLLVGDAAGSLQLAPGSPCLDAGTTDGAPTTDLNGNPRPAGAGVDMGAYEGPVASDKIVVLTVVVSPENGGRTTPPAGASYYLLGETAALTCTGTGSAFSRWSGAVDATTPEVSVIMDADKTVTAVFKPHVVHANRAQASPGDGSTWETAFNTLQAAVDAVAAGGGGEVWVAEV
jgi:hypothetical protein